MSCRRSIGTATAVLVNCMAVCLHAYCMCRRETGDGTNSYRRSILGSFHIHEKHKFVRLSIVSIFLLDVCKGLCYKRLAAAAAVVAVFCVCFIHTMPVCGCERTFSVFGRYSVDIYTYIDILTSICIVFCSHFSEHFASSQQLDMETLIFIQSDVFDILCGLELKYFFLFLFFFVLECGRKRFLFPPTPRVILSEQFNFLVCRFITISYAQGSVFSYANSILLRKFKRIFEL